MKYALRCYPIISRYIKEIERYYEMPIEELQRRNEERFLKIFRKAYMKSSFYYHLYTEAGINIEDICTLDDIKKLPVITKDMIKQHALEMLTVPKWKVFPNHTSGTTGSPLMVYESWESIWREQAYFYCYRKRCGFTYGECLASLRGNLGKKDTVMYVHLSHTLYLSSYNLNPVTSLIYFEALQKYKPKAIEGYPSALYILASYFEDNNLSYKIPVCFTSSENLMDWQRMKIEKVFQTKVFDHYGTTERSIRLSESLDHDGYFEDPGYSINEYTEDGEITTSLINSAFPLIRYKTFDIIELREQCRNQNNFIKSISGRTITTIRGKDGSVYNNAALTFILKEGKGIKFAQFIQQKDKHVDLNIVLAEGVLTEKIKVSLFDLIDEKIGLSNIDIEIHQISESELIYTSRNKFSYIISRIED